MPRSFQIVEDKIEEAEFFLNKVRLEIPGLNFQVINFYLSAFFSASRSITFCLQASLRDVEGFNYWYQKQQEKLRENNLAQFFLSARNFSQKVGYSPISGGMVNRDDNGCRQTKLYFQLMDIDGKNKIPETDILTACEIYFKQLLEIIVGCFASFGRVIDSDQYYTIENMSTTDLTIEDLEIELGFPKGWTDVKGFSLEDRVRLIRDHVPKNDIDWIFIKYLQTDRYGKPHTSETGLT